jgi:hypothetical protein
MQSEMILDLAYWPPNRPDGEADVTGIILSAIGDFKTFLRGCRRLAAH